MEDIVSTREKGWLASHTNVSTSLFKVACVACREPVRESVSFAFFIGGSEEEEDFRFLWGSINSVYVFILLG